MCSRMSCGRRPALKGSAAAPGPTRRGRRPGVAWRARPTPPPRTCGSPRAGPRRCPSGLEATLEDDALRPVLPLGGELDQIARTGLGHVLADASLSRPTSPWLGHPPTSCHRPSRVTRLRGSGVVHGPGIAVGRCDRRTGCVAASPDAPSRVSQVHPDVLPTGGPGCLSCDLRTGRWPVDPELSIKWRRAGTLHRSITRFLQFFSGSALEAV
jgi:hypothetical protein